MPDPDSAPGAVPGAGQNQDAAGQNQDAAGQNQDAAGQNQVPGEPTGGDEATEDGPTEAEPTEDGAARRTRQDPRRERTPKRLVAAARAVFERDGFYNARLSSITAEANLASGTLYNYYRSKHEIFRDVFKEVVEDLTALPPDHVSGQRDPVRRLEEVHRVYVRAVRRHGRLLASLYQARDTDEEIRALGDEISRHFQDRAVAAIERWQSAGLAYPDLDPLHTAHALTFMVERTAMAWFDGRVEYDEDTMVDTLNKIWVRALGLVPGRLPGAAPAPAARTRLPPRPRPVAADAG